MQQPDGERFTIDRRAKDAPEAVAAARAAVLALPRLRNTTNYRERRAILDQLNKDLAAKGLEPVTYSMLSGWATDILFRRDRHTRDAQ